MYGLDLGTYEIKVYDKKKDRIWFEKNAIAVKNKKYILAAGNKAYEMFEKAVEQEISWTNHIIGGNILGITEKTTESYTKWLANERLKVIGLQPLYEGYEKNPYKHLERFADTEGEGNVKANFFEGTVTSYNMSSSVEGWDEF